MNNSSTCHKFFSLLVMTTRMKMKQKSLINVVLLCKHLQQFLSNNCSGLFSAQSAINSNPYSHTMNEMVSKLYNFILADTMYYYKFRE